MNSRYVIIFAALCGLLLATTGCWTVDMPIPPRSRPRPQPQMLYVPQIMSPTILGASDEIVTLSLLDWQPPDKFSLSPSRDKLRKVPAAVAAWINDGMVRSELLYASSGTWSADILAAGRYRFTLRILPADSNIKVRLRPGTAHLNCGNIEAEKIIEPGTSFAEFVIELDKGPCQLQAYFTNQLPNKRAVGAFYLEARYLSR